MTRQTDRSPKRRRAQPGAYIFRGVPLVLVGAVCFGCLEPAADRAERDALIGSETADGVRLEVEDGLACIRELGAHHALLWQSAPRLRLDLTGAEGSFLLSVYNAPAQAELRVLQGRAQVRTVPSELPTRVLFELDVTAGDVVSLELGRPDWGVEPFRIGLMSDVQEAIGEVSDLYDRMNEDTQLDFLLGAGDLTRRGTVSELTRFERELERLNVPYYTTLGNHELGVEPPPYQALFGRGSFSFVHRGVRFTLLDSASATIDPLVYDWLEDWLRAGSQQLHFVAMHIPPVDPVGIRNGSFASRNETSKLFARLVAGKVDLTLYGHIHTYTRFSNAGIPARISGGGGALPQRFDGIGRHYLTIDVDPDEQTFKTGVVRID